MKLFLLWASLPWRRNIIALLKLTIKLEGVLLQLVSTGKLCCLTCSSKFSWNYNKRHLAVFNFLLANCVAVPSTILYTRFGCIIDDLPPLLTVLHCSQYFLQWQLRPWFDVIQPSCPWPSSCSCSWHGTLDNFLLQTVCVFSYNMTKETNCHIFIPDPLALAELTEKFYSLLSRVSILLLTRDIDIVILSVRPSVCPSVRDTLVLYENGLTYRHSFSTIR